MTAPIEEVVIHVDGGARGNPGPAGAGVVISDPDGTPLHEAGYWLGRCTNNVAEYSGLLKALEVATTMNAQKVAVRSDSQLMVKQLLGEYRVKSADLKPLYQKASALLSAFPASTITHVYRDKNKRADQLANLAMDAETDRIVNAWPGA
ncbi:MAG: ribonuclease HI family protein [Planctomycetota bacterium]